MANLNQEKLKKYILLTIIVFFSIIFLIKFSLSFIENKISSTLKSKKFEIFIMNEFNNKLESFANKTVSESEYIFYKDNFYKIFKKYKPIFDEVEIDEVTNNNDLNENQLRKKLEKIYLKHRVTFLDIEENIEK